MPSPTDFNISPYFDDFNETKNYHRILFRPSFAVQARELTQSQTILQNQVERMGDHFFKQGSMVIPGQLSIDTNYTAVKLTSKSNSDLNAYLNQDLLGDTSKVGATVIKVVASDGTDPDTLYIKYTSADSVNNIKTVFDDGETVTAQGSGDTFVVDTTATGSAAGIEAGIYYINGYMVRVESSSLVLDKYTNEPSYRIGLQVTESFITSGDDTSLDDNAQGYSNANAPGAHRLKITLSLAKRTLSSTEDSNFYEIARVKNGNILSQVRSTEYAVLEDTLARRTFDESGDYVLSNPDFEVREHLKDTTSSDSDIVRGIYLSSEGGLESKLAIGISPFKAYVNGYENENMATTFVDLNKGRDFTTINNNKTTFDVDNFVNVSNIYNTPDFAEFGASVEAFKSVNLHDVATDTKGVERATSGAIVPQIGRAKSRGFETALALDTDANLILDDTSVYKHYLFDIEMFTHLNLLDNTSFTTGDIVSGSTSGASGVVQNSSVAHSEGITSINTSNSVVTASGTLGLKDGQQIKFLSPVFEVDSVAVTTSDVFTVRNADYSANTFELYKSDGTTIANVTAFTSTGNATHGVLVLANVEGTFASGEVVTNDSSASATVQNTVLGLSGASVKEFSSVKQIAMDGTPPYTSDTSLSTAYGDNTTLVGNISIANSSKNILGKGTFFLTDLKPGDQISFDTDAGNNITGTVAYIVSDTSLFLTSDVGGSDVTTAGILVRQRTKINSPENNIMVFKLPYDNVKTLKTTLNNFVTDTNYKVRRQKTEVINSSNQITITLGNGETFSTFNSKDYSASVTVGSDIGKVFKLDSMFTLNQAQTELVLDFGGYNGQTVKITYSVNKPLVNSKTKTLTNVSSLSITNYTDSVISLGKADVYRVNSITMGSDDITDRFELDTGQRDNFYDIGRIKLKTGAIKPTANLTIDFDYFEHGSGDYFDVDSYNAQVDYENIPSYTSDTTGATYELRDSLDFRPRVEDASTINSGGTDRQFDGTGASVVEVPEFNSVISSDLEFYLSRIDKIFMTREGEFKVVEGASDINPLEPNDLSGHMLLATVNIPAYTLDVSDVTVTPEDNRRFTMRDIGKLEGRIQNLEYYTQLSLLEQDAQNLQIQDTNGLDRFKNGFIVDNFTGHNIGDVGNIDYKTAIDRARGEARTLFNEDTVELEEVDNDGSVITATDRTDANYQLTGDVVTLPYTETTYLEQPYATATENLNPFLVFNWIGTAELDPPVDEWRETEVAPDLIANVNGSFDNLARDRGLSAGTTRIPLSTEWNNWQDQWSGNPRTTTSGRTTTTTNTVVQTRSGIRSEVIPQTVRQSLGNRVISIAFVPFIRSRAINFTAYGMRPNVRVYPFFDNIDVSAYTTPASIVTDANGTATGTFTIPDPKVSSNPRWRTGKRVFRLTSSATNSQDKTAIATSAEADYDAKGLLQTVQEAIISTREARTVRRTVNQTRSTSRVTSVVTQPQERDGGRDRGPDPLAQSFVVSDADGIFVTSVDAFFATKSDTVPVKAEIRNMVNGYPGTKLIPFSEKWLNASQVNTSTDGTVATTFTFNSPVYLNEGVEYCIILYSDSADYTAYIAKLGSKTLDSNRTVSKQPTSGVLFKSANYRTWTPEQTEDLKFTLKKAVFDTTTTGTLTLANKALPTRTLVTNPLRTFNGSTVLRVHHPNHGMLHTSDNVILSGAASLSNGITEAQVNTTFNSISNITLDSYDVTTAGTATVTGDEGSTAVTATQNRPYDVLQLQIGNVVHPGTSLNTTLRTTTGNSLDSGNTSFAYSRDLESDVKSVVISDNIYFTEPKVVLSEINEKQEIGSNATTRYGNQSLIVNVSMTTDNPNLSPIIDMKRLNAFAITNRLSNPIVYSTDTFTGNNSDTDFTLSGTPESAHHVKVTLNGTTLAPFDDYTISGSTLTITSTPANGAQIVAKITNTINYEDDTATLGGSSAGSYITRPITLENPSTALEIRVAGSVRSTSQLRCYFRVTGGMEQRRIEDIPFTPFNLDGTTDDSVKSSEGQEVLDRDFKDYKWSAENISDFSSFQIKIVFRGTNSAYAPRIKDLRGIALAV